MMKYLQKLGKALMLPVAVLPICGILMGLGYAQFLEILHHKAHSSLRNVCVYRRLWLQAVHNSVIE